MEDTNKQTPIYLIHSTLSNDSKKGFCAQGLTLLFCDQKYPLPELGRFTKRGTLPNINLSKYMVSQRLKLSANQFES